jgi:hypothetical protein
LVVIPGSYQVREVDPENSSNALQNWDRGDDFSSLKLNQSWARDRRCFGQLFLAQSFFFAKAPNFRAQSLRVVSPRPSLLKCSSCHAGEISRRFRREQIPLTLSTSYLIRYFEQNRAVFLKIRALILSMISQRGGREKGP